MVLHQEIVNFHHSFKRSKWSVTTAVFSLSASLSDLIPSFPIWFSIQSRLVIVSFHRSSSKRLLIKFNVWTDEFIATPRLNAKVPSSPRLLSVHLLDILHLDCSSLRFLFKMQAIQINQSDCWVNLQCFTQRLCSLSSNVIVYAYHIIISFSSSCNSFSVK